MFTTFRRIDWEATNAREKQTFLCLPVGRPTVLIITRCCTEIVYQLCLLPALSFFRQRNGFEIVFHLHLSTPPPLSPPPPPPVFHQEALEYLGTFGVCRIRRHRIFSNKLLLLPASLIDLLYDAEYISHVEPVRCNFSSNGWRVTYKIYVKNIPFEIFYWA